MEAAVPLATQIQNDFSSGDVDVATNHANELKEHAHSASDLTSDPVWRVAELVPVVGTNLAAFRQAAAVLNDVAGDAIVPLITNVSNIGVDNFRPTNGAIDLAPLVEARPVVASARETLDAAVTDANMISTEGTLDQISSAVVQLRESLSKADVLIKGVDNAVTLVPPMLGVDGPRNYILLFQNPAELRAGGGVTSALAQISTNNGRVELVRQASSTDFQSERQPALSLPPETEALFSNRATRFIQNTTLVPQFELTGQIAAAMWKTRFGVDADGVVSFDPVALSYLLDATGPITLPTTQVEITSSNAVEFLLSDVYKQFPDPSVQDGVFAEAARAVFDKVAEGKLDPAKLLQAMVRAGDEGRLKLWSAHAEDQAVLANSSLSGGLPSSSIDSTGVGVYFNDATGAKMDVYLKSAVETKSAQCRTNGRPTVSSQVTLTNTVAADAALPEYVTGGQAFGVPRGSIRTIVYIYSPANADPNEPILIAGIDPGTSGSQPFSARDGEHLVVGFSVELAPGETKTVSADFAYDNGASLVISPVITPTVNPTVYSTEINRGFSEC
ncbi:DUF4012 domain-containing protein [Herbiconiux solani]|uniref:DUF4012 domain-containing protein n=1 Tax=Herbiconiux solani TaxID=661329 RepID=UPI001471B5E6|nr:DUF4012 domain-containing protein [Herbiconiux solani]